MNPLVKKEIRLLLPSWLAALVLLILLPILPSSFDTSFQWTPFLAFFVSILLAVDSFGREFSLGTYSSLMSQPIERRRIWRVKLTVLFIAAALLLMGFLTSDTIIHVNQPVVSALHHHPGVIFRNLLLGMISGGLLMLVGLVGGLWTTLLFRQIAAAFWIAFLVPLGLLITILFFLPEKLASDDHFLYPLLYSLAGIYCAAGFWFAHRLFHRAQDIAWTGGVISISRWRYFEGGTKTSISMRRRRPIFALLKKEFQLHGISLLCAGALLTLQVGVFFMRGFYASFHKDSVAELISEFFWMLWLIMPLTIGCMAVAEERKLGVVDGQFCQPVSRRLHFTVKFVPTVLFGVFLGGVMPLLLEALAARLGVPNDYFQPSNHVGVEIISGIVWFYVCVIGSAAGLALIGFFASTLARSFLQALSIAIVTTIICFLSYGLLFRGRFGFDNRFDIGSIEMGSAILMMVISVPTILILVPWLAWRNFTHFTENGRLWRRNATGIIGGLLFVLAGSAVIYNRAWEVFEPAGPTHGPARLLLKNPIPLQRDYFGALQVRLPEGRIWLDTLDGSFWDNTPNVWKQFWWRMVPPLPKSAGPAKTLPGKNWISVTTTRRVNWGYGTEHINGYLDTVGIQADGSLWISSEARPVVWTGEKMIQFGTETNWRQVVRYFGRGFLLLKTNGTLWQWHGLTNRFDWSEWRTNWPTVRNFKPQQIGTNHDWVEIYPGRVCARKTDGSVWSVRFENNPGVVEFQHQTNFDKVVLGTFSSGDNRAAYVGKDGTLWIGNWHTAESGAQNSEAGFLRVGAETNWVTTAMDQVHLIVLKSDGSLWQWKLTAKSAVEAGKISPTRFGIHNDWVGLTSTWGGFASLAADGSLWFWPGSAYDGALMKAPKQPELLGNVLSGTKR